MNILLAFCLFITLVFVFNFFRFWIFLIKKVTKIFGEYESLEKAKESGYDLEYSKIGGIIRVMIFSFVFSILSWSLYISKF